VGDRNWLLKWIARGLENPHLVSGCAAPTEGLALDCQLACDPSGGCIVTTRSSLPGSKSTSVKNIVSSLAEVSLVIVYVIDWIYLFSTTSV